MPRRSAASLAVTPASFLQPPPSPIQPPASLSEPARAVFLEIAGSVEPEHFQACDIHLLSAYATAVVLAETAEPRLINPDGTPNSRWLAAWREASRTMKDLSLRLRISPQARREKAQKPRTLTWSK